MGGSATMQAGTRVNAEQAPKRLMRKPTCAVERRVFLLGANPTQQLLLRLVAARAVHGGNDMG